MSENVAPPAAADSMPVLVDLGKKKKKAIKRLRRGEGALMTDIAHEIEQLKAAGTVGASVQPIIVVVKEKPARRRGFLRMSR